MSEIRGKEVAQLTVKPGAVVSVSVDADAACALPPGTYRLYTAGCKGCGKRSSNVAAELDAEVATIERRGFSVTLEQSPAAIRIPEGKHSLRLSNTAPDGVAEQAPLGWRVRCTRRHVCDTPCAACVHHESALSESPQTLFGLPVVVDPSIPTPPGEIAFGVKRHA